MAKKKSKSPKVEEKDLPNKQVEEVEEEEEEEDEEEETEMVYLQVDTGDIVKLKQILDETVANTFLEDSILDELNGVGGRKSLGFKEDHALNNLKLALMTVACAFAMVAQFAPLPFPESRFVLGGCCAAYFVLSGLLQLIVTFLDKDSILITKINEGVSSSIQEKNPNLAKHGLRVRTTMPRFSEFYTVNIEFDGLEKSPYVSKTWSVGKFFDVEGMFDEYGLELEVEELYRKFEAGNFDKDDNKATEKKVKTN
jgi:signal peptidase complex subunit 2